MANETTSVTDIAKPVISVATTALGASWSGIIAMAVAIIGGLFGIHFLIKSLNKATDKKDLENAGADAGKTSVDIKNQADSVASTLDEMLRKDPPKGT